MGRIKDLVIDREDRLNEALKIAERSAEMREDLFQEMTVFLEAMGSSYHAVYFDEDTTTYLFDTGDGDTFELPAKFYEVA